MRPIIIRADSVSTGLAEGIKLLINRDEHVVKEDSRNGPVLVWPGPVLTHYTHPARRVLFCPLRNANPFFHLFESFWMLAGRNDLPWVAQFNRQMKSYSDDGGKTQPAAYGYRWRSYFGYDQIEDIVAELKANPGTRRAVLAMWDGWGIHQMTDVLSGDTMNHFGDLQGAIAGSADVPCNTHCYFTVRDGKLHMSVQCRSNDILWGAYGANAVHFSVLLEYLAARCGYEMGEMMQYSWNWHLYTDVLKVEPASLEESLRNTDAYTGRVNAIQPLPLFTPDDVAVFDMELRNFMEMLAPNDNQFVAGFTHPAFADLALPMWEAWKYHKAKNYDAALHSLYDIPNDDWRKACAEWLRARAAKRAEA